MAVQETTTPACSKDAWMEPELCQLHVRETAAASHVGGDGQTTYADCTKS